MDLYANTNIIVGEMWDLFKVVVYKLRFSFGFRVMYLRILQAQRSTAATHRSSWKKLLLSGDTDVTSGGRVSIDVRDYDVRVFSQLIGFLHSGRVKVDISTALGRITSLALLLCSLRSGRYDWHRQ